MNAFCSSVVSGLTTAAVWAVVLWLVNLGRNKWVERQLRGSLCRIGTQYGDEGFGATLKNETRISILVRDVVFLTEDPEQGIGLLYDRPTYDFMIVEKKTRKPMTFKTKTRTRDLKRETTAHGFVMLPPETGGIWTLDPRFYFENADLVLTGARATVEFKTFFGNPKITIVESNEGSSGLIQKTYGQFLEYIGKKRELEQAESTVPVEAAPSASSTVR